MSDPEHARMMLLLARQYLKALQGMLDPEIFATAIFGFHAQQAVEKSIKAWLNIAGVVYPKIHDLEELFALLEEHGSTVPPKFKALGVLTDFEVMLRYEAVDISDEEITDRKSLLNQVQEFMEHVKAMLDE